MKGIHSRADFEAALQAERAIVLIYFGWSTEAAASREALERWERECGTSGSDGTIYELAPDEQPDTWKWVGEHATDAKSAEASAGAVLWLCAGQVAGRIQSAAGLDGQTLLRLTKQFFKLGTIGDDHDLLQLLCCPETRQELTPATPAILETLNRQLSAGTLRSRNGRTIRERVEGGLVRADGKVLYPIRSQIPILLVDEAIAIA